MSTRRTRDARRLSSILTTESGVWTIVRYFRPADRYDVQWTGGPTEAQMRELAARHADGVPELDVNDLAWLRTEPSLSRPQLGR
ncbi:hypothetical protein JOF56_009545 [Kibdelosporangium banguiense]|uniref:Uncharacterized protein n=1 Tax=Kibdelosporangium banguiense TaxID=1365924 RepID=A0ABS4TXN9_9PSEU|nr:hypothetical protein [Kibdelosporangium banguiense]MBP2329160.1 hypothetical protein [Kibdelosporangium banguiense]